MKKPSSEFVKSEDLPDLCRPRELADYFRVSLPTAIKWLTTKENPPLPEAFKVGRQWRIPKEAIIRLAHDMYGERGSRL